MVAQVWLKPQHLNLQESSVSISMGKWVLIQLSYWLGVG